MPIGKLANHDAHQFIIVQYGKEGMMNYSKDKKRLIFIGIIVTALIVMIVVAVILAVTQGGKGKKEEVSNASEFSVPSNELRINDLYLGEKRIPNYDVPLNKYVNENFLKAASSGRIFYEEAALGIDVSDYQKDIDWAKVAADEIDYAIIRVGFRGFTEGGLVLDDRFLANITGALENGIEVGVYFFSQAISNEEAVEEAAYVVKQLEGFELTYPIFFDWEPITNHSEEAIPRTKDCTATDVTAFTKAFCEEIKKNGYYPAYYTNKNMGYSMYNLEELRDYDMWYAEYQDIPSFYYHFDMWQYTEAGVVDGIPVQVDLNLSMKRYK